jgi:DNA-binding transcriptional regulator YbjK
LVPGAESPRRAILGATLRVVAAGGIDAVTHRRVAAEARVPLGSTTYYFRSRDEMLIEAFRQYMADIRSMIDLLGEEFPQRDFASFLDLLVAFTQREFRDPALVLAEYELNLFAVRNPGLAEEVRAWQRTMVSLVSERLEDLGAERPNDAARTLVAAMRGFEIDLLLHTEQSFEQFRARLEVLLRGLLPAQSLPAKQQRPNDVVGRRVAPTSNRTGAQSGPDVRAHARRNRMRAAGSPRTPAAPSR